MNDPLEVIWSCFDAPSVAFAPEEIARWPAGALEHLVALGAVCDAEPAQHTTCPHCPEHHVEEVLYRAGPNGVRYFIPCPQTLREEVPAQQLRRWTINFDAVARSASSAIVESGRCTSLLAGRLWRLGRVNWQGSHRDVVLVRGLIWPDGAQLTTRIDGTGRTIVLVADRIPNRRFWPDLPPPVVALSAIAHLLKGEISINRADIFATAREVDAANRQVRPLALSRKEQKQALRDAAGDALKAALHDDELVTAWREHGSVRKAAAALTKERGVEISKDSVQRALDRQGGAALLRAKESSESVQRTVASRRRDRQRKFASPSQPHDLE